MVIDLLAKHSAPDRGLPAASSSNDGCQMRFEKLKALAIALGDSFPIMPIDEIRLAVAFAKLLAKEHVVERLIDEMFDDPNMHVRRIAVNACRRAKAFDAPMLKEALTRKLEDPEPWVRYDAAWAIGDAGYDCPRIRQLLSAIAGIRPLAELKVLVRAHTSNAALQAQARARETLDLLDGHLEG